MPLGLNDYRSIKIKADAANTSIAPIRLSQNDHDGRRIIFELWDGAEAVDGSGLSARLLFGVGEGGYATMTAVSGASTATWAVDVPTEAVAKAGIVRMAVEVASGTQAVCTRIFDAVVEPAIIDEESQEAQDALSEFREAVARLEDFTVPVPIANGGTGATTADAAWTALGGGAVGKLSSIGASNLPIVPVSKGGTGTDDIATARNSFYLGNVQLTSANKQSVAATMMGNSGLIVIQRGTTKAIVLVDLWTSEAAIIGNLPTNIVLVRGAASGNSGLWTIQNNLTNQAIALNAIGLKFGQVQDNETAMTENITRVQL